MAGTTTKTTQPRAAWGAQPAAVAPLAATSTGAKIRELADELMLVFVIVMFIKLFVVELYKIPTGSMTPTLLGGKVAWIDVNQDGHKDLVYLEHPRDPLLFIWHNGRYLADPAPPDMDRVNEWDLMGLFDYQYDRILVNKVAYWFRNPRRGEIVVFKVPESIFSPQAPIFIKRCVGEPGDTLTFPPGGRLVANGRLVTVPDFFTTQHYRSTVNTGIEGYSRQPDVTYQDLPGSERKLLKIAVPADKAYVFGDNTEGSLDSRYWGGVPLANFKGRAFLRLWPLTQLAFLK